MSNYGYFQIFDSIRFLLWPFEVHRKSTMAEFACIFVFYSLRLRFSKTQGALKAQNWPKLPLNWIQQKPTPKPMCWQEYSSSWWLNRSSNWIISPGPGENKQHLKPPPRYSTLWTWTWLKKIVFSKPSYFLPLDIQSCGVSYIRWISGAPQHAKKFVVEEVDTSALGRDVLVLGDGLYYQPKQCTINGKSLKFTIHLHCLMPPKYVI